MGLLDIFKSKEQDDKEIVQNDIIQEDNDKESSIQEDKTIKKEVSKEGYVYVISNRGSFGPDIYKVGATKKKDPQDRVDDLGDASVPFKFDVHALIYSADVFELEAQLHRFLKEYEINKVNHRKEFYKVPLDTIKEIVKKLGYKPKWTDEAPAIEFERSKNL